MKSNDATIEILKSIRDEISGTNARLDGHATILDRHTTILSGHGKSLDGHTRILDGHTTHLESLELRIERLHQRQVESEIRLATELTNVIGAIHEVRDELRNDRALRARVDDHEQRIERLETRAG